MRQRVEAIKNYNLEKALKYNDYHHEVILWEINCDKKMMRMVEYIDFDKDGKVIDRYKYDQSEWSGFIPKSKGEILYKKVCVTRQ